MINWVLETFSSFVAHAAVIVPVPGIKILIKQQNTANGLLSFGTFFTFYHTKSSSSFAPKTLACMNAFVFSPPAFNYYLIFSLFD